MLCRFFVHGCTFLSVRPTRLVTGPKEPEQAKHQTLLLKCRNIGDKFNVVHVRFRAAIAVVDAASNPPPLQFVPEISKLPRWGGGGGLGEGEAGEAAGDHHGFRLCVRLSEPVHSDPLTVSARPILQPPR